MSDWKVKKHRGKCAVSGKPFLPGDSFFSAIIEEDGLFKRIDLSLDAFDKDLRGRSFSYWKGQVPLPEEDDQPRHRLVDSSTLTAFFRKLSSADNDEHSGFCYLIALLLMRKKILKLKDILFEGDIEWMILTETKTKNEFRIKDPHLKPDELGPLRGQLSKLFESPEMFEKESEADDEPQTSPDEEHEDPDDSE